MYGVAVPPLSMPRFLLAVIAVAFSGTVFAAPLDPLLQDPQIWSSGQTEFATMSREQRYRWTSEAQDSARSDDDELTCFGLPVVESVARFREKKVAELIVTFYARGDAGELPQEKFQATLKAIIDALNLHTKAKLTVRGKDATSAVKAEGLIWDTPAARYLLEYSFTKKIRDVPFRAEFIRLEITPPSKPVGLLATVAAASKTKFVGETHVQKDAATGDVFIRDVPMVDQGQKGYCAVACTERVMRYYGVAVDANELAQVANTQTTGGTSANEMFDAIKKLSARLRVRVRPMEQLEVKGLLELIKDYNRVAKRGDRAPLIPDPGLMIDVGGMYRVMQFDVLKEVRTKNKSDLNRFQRDVQAQVDTGIPLIWSVMLGMVPEKGIPQNAGGHMRLIIGYNTKTQEVLFSDSWGAGHELKRMPMDDAWTITTGLTKIEPFS